MNHIIYNKNKINLIISHSLKSNEYKKKLIVKDILIPPKSINQSIKYHKIYLSGKSSSTTKRKFREKKQLL
ncbi:9169_t:CDS:2 [Acaulospora colombiana]|uniref:9169_t:CDS:1 n=1 Tax=Acaulospora colombiana TaxID=27376 RepID=A0ACA9L7I1_9GLOM|nr:9169_t:CDS:2 [Acaulospora colombiana]